LDNSLNAATAEVKITSTINLIEIKNTFGQTYFPKVAKPESGPQTKKKLQNETFGEC